jgi:hypothetical protein
MKTLNRPMFRYGGPIKEGVMNGIREPKRNGGSMGTRKAALVGNPVYPQTNGRENHYINFLAPVVAGAIRYGKPVLQAGKRIFGKTTPASVTKGTKFNRAQSVKEFGPGSGRATGVTMNPSKFDPNYLGRDPILRSVGAIGKGIFSPTSKGVVAKAARFATAPSSVVAGVAYYMWPDGKERTAPPNKVDKDRRGTSDAPGGGDPGMYSTPKADQPEALTAEEVKAAENKARNEQMDRYREIIDIKGMNKDAAYKSLIDASKIIQEGGNLKKSLKDGSLISKVTAAASKRFDKVSDTENALRSLVVKGEIDNELNKVDKDLKRRALEGQIKVNEKALAGLTTGEMIQKILGRAQGEYPKGDALRQIISINNPQLNAKVLPTGDMPTGADALEYAVSMINTRNNDETTPDYPEGVYVIKDRVIQVIDGQVIPVPINKL